MDVDPIRKLIWSLGNGTSEASLCASLESFFHTLCPLANVFDEEICKDYKKAYAARCSPNAHRLAQEGTFLYVAIVLIFCLAMASFLKAKRILYIPDSAVTIIVGFLTGALFVVSSANHRFNEQVFFEILLPFIVFEAGYNMDKQLLSQNFSIISALAIFGTFISFTVTTLLMKVGNEYLGRDLSDLDCAMFGALISSTDPIAIVNVFSSLGVNPRLYALVLGESALNDGVAVALYSSMKHFYSHPESKDTEALIYVLWNFLAVGVGSVCLGFGFGMLTAYFWKLRGRSWLLHPVLETLLFLVCAIVPYYIADALKWSGVIAVVAGSMTLSVYAHGNLSATSRFHVVFVVECIARLCEAVMFGYVGTQIVANNTHMVWNNLILVALAAVLIARAAAVFPILQGSNFITTRCLGRKQVNPQGANASGVSSRLVPFRQQVVIWFSGLRGALSFALAVTVPEYDTVLKQGSKHSGEILACTCFVILVNVFFMGAIAPFTLRAMGVVQKQESIATVVTSHQQEANLSNFQPDRQSLIGRIHSSFMVPTLMLHHQEQDGHRTARETSMLAQSPFSPGTRVTNEPIPDEHGFIHVVFDDELEPDDFGSDEARLHSFLFPRSRMAMPRSRQQTATSVDVVPNTEGNAISPQTMTSLTDALLTAVEEEDRQIDTEPLLKNSSAIA